VLFIFKVNAALAMSAVFDATRDEIFDIRVHDRFLRSLAQVFILIAVVTVVPISCILKDVRGIHGPNIRNRRLGALVDPTRWFVVTPLRRLVVRSRLRSVSDASQSKSIGSALVVVLPVSLSVVLAVSLSVVLAVSLSVVLPVSLAVVLPVSLAVVLPVSLAVVLPVSLAVVLPVSLAVVLTVSLPVVLTVSLTVVLPIASATALRRATAPRCHYRPILALLVILLVRLLRISTILPSLCHLCAVFRENVCSIVLIQNYVK